MGNFKFGHTAAAYTATLSGAGGENASYPLTNLQLYKNRKQHCRTVNIGTEAQFKLDFSTAKAILTALLVDCNFTACYIATSTDNMNWLNEQAFTVTADARGMYNLWATLASQNRRYMRLRVPVQATTDGAAYFRIGILACLNTVIELLENPDVGTGAEWDEASEENKFTSGSVEVISLGDPLWQRTFSFKNYPRVYTSQLEFLIALKKDGVIFFYENLGNTARAYVCRRITPFGVVWGAATLDDIGNITLREWS